MESAFENRGVRVYPYPRVGSGMGRIFGTGTVRVLVASSATGTGRVAKMVDPHTPKMKTAI